MQAEELNLAKKILAIVVIAVGAVGASVLVFGYLAYFIGQNSVSPPPVASPGTAPAPTLKPSPGLPTSSPGVPSPGIPVPSPNLLTPSSPGTASSPLVPSSPGAPGQPSPPATATTGSGQSRLQESLKGFFAKQTGVSVNSVSCPASAQPTAGSSFECQVSAENTTFPIQVQVRNNEGDYRIEAKGLLVLAQLEQQIQSTVKEKTGVTIKANCGARLRMTKPGETFQCQAISEQGQTKPVIVTVEDDKGSIRWRI